MTPRTPHKSSKNNHFGSQNGSQNRSRRLPETPLAPRWPQKASRSPLGSLPRAKKKLWSRPRAPKKNLGLDFHIFAPPEAPQSVPEAIFGASGRQPGSEEASGSLRDRFWEPFWLQKCCFLMIFWVSAASFFHRVFGVDVCMFLCAFRLRAKTADMRNLQYLPHENVFFKVRSCAAAAGKAKKTAEQRMQNSF